ncbi:hypothetical protein [Streptomyces sp. NPDC001450]
MGVGDDGAWPATPAAVGHDTAHADTYAHADTHADTDTYADADIDAAFDAPAVGTVQQPAQADAGRNDGCPVAATEAGGDTEAALGTQALGDDGTEVHACVTTAVAAVSLTTVVTSVTTSLIILITSVTADTVVDTVVHESRGNGCCSAHGRRQSGRRPCLLAVGRRPARSCAAPKGPHRGGHRAGRQLLVPDLVAPWANGAAVWR